MAARGASAATRTSCEHDPPARPRAHPRHRGTSPVGVVCRNPMHRRLQPHAAEADPTCRRCAAMQLACFAVACSQRDVESLLLLSSWSPGQPHGQLTAAVQQLVAGASNSLSPPAWSDGTSSEYLWARLVLLVLQCFCQRQQASADDSSRAMATPGSPGRPPPLWPPAENREAGGAASHQKLLRRWLVHQLVGSGLLVAPQLGSLASSDRSALVLGCSVQSRVELPRSAQIAMRGCGATVEPIPKLKTFARSTPRRTFSSSRADWLGRSRCTPSL